MKINKLVKHRRIERSLTQQELAKQLGIRQATISDFELGKRSIGSKTLDLIFDFLGIEIK